MREQWLRYLYGQFSTHGYPGDPLYPLEEEQEEGLDEEQRNEQGKDRVEEVENMRRPVKIVTQTKQSLLCGTDKDENNSVINTEMSPVLPSFTYSLPGRTTTQVMYGEYCNVP